MKFWCAINNNNIDILVTSMGDEIIMSIYIPIFENIVKKYGQLLIKHKINMMSTANCKIMQEISKE